MKQNKDDNPLQPNAQVVYKKLQTSLFLAFKNNKLLEKQLKCNNLPGTQCSSPWDEDYLLQA